MYNQLYDQQRKLMEQEFVRGLPEELDRLEFLVLRMEKNLDFQIALGEFLRLVHSIKGRAITHGFAFIAEACDGVESTLAGIGSPVPTTWEIILKSVELVRCTLSGSQKQNGTSATQGIMDQWRSQLKEILGPQRSRVLLVDNVHSSAALIKSTLEAFAQQVVLVQDGYEALGWLLRSPFALVVTILESPSIDGLSLIGATRAITTIHPKPRFVLLTASDDVEFPLENRADVVLVRDQTLGEKLRHCLESEPLALGRN